MSTKQGHFADKENNQDLQLQAYRDLKEYMSDFLVDVIPFKSQLVDEFYDPLDKNSVKNVYGMLYYYLGNDRKPSYQQFSFVINKLQDYTQVCRDEMLIKAKRPYDFTSDVQSVMFLNEKKDKVLTVIFPSSERIVTSGNNTFTKVTLKSAINRMLYIPNGTKVTIDNPTDVNFKNYDFILVEENLLTQSKTKEELLSEVDLKLRFYETYIKNILSMIPDDYNKEVYDTNFYKLIRAVGIEYGDMRYEMKILEDNMYLSTAHGDAIYNNFGAVIGVKWKPKWSEKQYREAVSGIIDALLHGANKNSIQRAIKAYTGFDVKIYEMFSDYEHYGLTQEVNWDNQYRFTVEVSKDLDDKQELKDINEYIKEVLEITKPAHTLPIIMIVLVGKEDYRKWYKERYGRNFSESDDFDSKVITLEESNKFGWKAKQYDWILQSNPNIPIKTNSNYLIGARYTLYDRSWLDYEQYYHVTVPKPIEQLLLELRAEYNDIWNRKIIDEYNMNLAFYLSEIKFGTKPNNTEHVLKTNGGLILDRNKNVIGTENRKMNTHKTGFHFSLNDNMLILYEYLEKEKYDRIVKEEYYSELLQTIEEKYDKQIKEDYHIEHNVYLSEIKFGYVPSHIKALITYKQPPMRRQQRRVNQNVTGVKYRLLDYLFVDELTQYSEKIKKASEQVTMKLFKINADGSETIIEERSV